MFIPGQYITGCELAETQDVPGDPSVEKYKKIFHCQLDNWSSLLVNDSLTSFCSFWLCMLLRKPSVYIPFHTTKNSKAPFYPQSAVRLQRAFHACKVWTFLHFHKRHTRPPTTPTAQNLWPFRAAFILLFDGTQHFTATIVLSFGQLVSNYIKYVFLNDDIAGAVWFHQSQSLPPDRIQYGSS